MKESNLKNYEILIVDEILSVGDMRFQAKCFNKFKECLMALIVVSGLVIILWSALGRYPKLNKTQLTSPSTYLSIFS